jgi:pimeloyl-ACP methyl ester carboxylesterase
LAVDLKNLIEHMNFANSEVSAIGTSLGAAILWYVARAKRVKISLWHIDFYRSYAELFTTSPFKKLIFVDQAPLQNYLSDWGPEFGNRGCNTPEALATIQHTLETDPKVAHRGTIAACLGYRSHPQPGDPQEGSKEWVEDEAFFLAEAMKGDGKWYGKLMADHTALDWRDTIAQSFGPESGGTTGVLVVASTRSGCFPAAGPLKVVELVNGGSGEGRAEGVAVEWGGHWCYWEEPEKFHELILEFLK